MTSFLYRYCWLMPVMAVGVLAADIAEPGHLKFIDLPFAIQSQISQVRFDPPLPLKIGADCQQLTRHPKLLQASTVLTQQLPLHSEQDLLTQLGPPACSLTGDAYQWMLTNGMALTATINEGGLVTDVQIHDPAIGE